MNRYKIVNNIDTANSTAEMLIYDEIGFGGVQGSSFANSLNSLLYANPPIKTVNVRINSVGGSVLDGFSIFSAIYNANKIEGVEVNTYCDGIAASIAGVILMAGKNVYMKDYSTLMLHGVSVVDSEGNQKENLSEETKKTLNVFKDMIKKVYCSKTNKEESVIDELLTNGRDNWFTAKEAVDHGFLPSSNIEKTGLMIDLPEYKNALVIANKAQKIIDSKNFKKHSKMRNIISLLNLQEGVNEEVISNAVKNVLSELSESKTKLAEAENKLEETNKKVEELNLLVEEANNSVANSLVESAIKEGKIAPKTEEEKESLVNQAVKDVESFKNMIAMIPVKAMNIMNGVSGETKDTILDRIDNRGFRQIEREEPSLLKELKNSAKSEYVKLYNAEYNTNKTEKDF